MVRTTTLTEEEQAKSRELLLAGKSPLYTANLLGLKYNKVLSFSKHILGEVSIKKAVAETDYIENMVDLCKEMTGWVRYMKQRVEEVKEEDAALPKEMAAFKREGNFMWNMNSAFHNFVELLKVPVKNTQVNILQQRIEGAYQRILDESRIKPMVAR